MLEAEIREFRESVGDSIIAPPFDDLVSRSRRRRRGTIVGIAAAGVLLVGAAVGAGQVVEQRAETPPVSHTNEPSGPGSADEIIDDANARLFDYEVAPNGRAMSHWAVDCQDETCPSALAWTNDDWATRETRYLSSFVEADLLEDGMLIYNLDEDPDYLLTDAGDEIDLLPPTAAQPVRPDEIMIYRKTSSTWLALDPASGATHRLLGPDGVSLQVVDKLPNGELHANGPREDDTMVYATSTDGGRNWVEHDVPVGAGSPSVLSLNDNVVMVMQGLQGVELTVSNDAGKNWHQLDDVPFGGTGCMFALDNGRLLVTTGTRLYTSTDATWSQFEEVSDAPSLGCLSYSFTRAMQPGAVSGVAGDQSGAYTSTDNGQTWTEVDPR